MNDSLQQILFSEGKELYKLRHLPSTRKCSMNRGICCPDEWFEPLRQLTMILEQLNRLTPQDAVHATKVKCESGHLRFCIDGPRNKGNKAFSQVIRVFEELLVCAPTKTRQRNRKTIRK